MHKSVILAIVLFCVVASVLGGEGKGKHGGRKGGRGKGMMKCKGKSPSWESHKESFTKCKDKFGGKKGGGGGGGDHKDMMCKMAAFQKCMWEDRKIIHDGKIDAEELKKSFSEMYPDDHIGEELGKIISDKCATEENAKDLGNSDACVGMKPLMECVWKHKKEYCGNGGKKKDSGSGEEKEK